MRKITFRFSIIQCYLILTAITTLIICGTFYFYSRDAVITLSKKITTEISSKTNSRITDFFVLPDVQEKILSHLVGTSNFISQEDRLLRLLWEFAQALPDVESIVLADEYGNYLQARLHPELATRVINRNLQPPIEIKTIRDENYRILSSEKKVNPEFDHRTRDWYKQAREILGTRWSEPYIANTTKQTVVSGTHAIYLEKKFVGVVNLNIPLSELSEFMGSQQVSEHGIAFIVNTSGDLIGYPDKNLIKVKDNTNGNWRLGKINDLSQNWIKEGWDHYQKEKNDSFSYSAGGNTYLASFTQLSEPSLSSWRIGVIIPESDVTAVVDKTLVIALSVAGAIFLLSLYPLLWFARRLSNPIKELVEQTHQLRDFRLDNIRVVDSPIIEMNTLSNSIVSAAQGLKAFQKYIPAELVRQLMSTGDAIEVGGESRYLTMLFSDLQNFSTLSESTPSRELLLRVSGYFEIFVKAINEEKGYVDKFIGDAVMAFWGAPLLEHHHAYHACVAAIKAQRRMKIFNEGLLKEEKPELIVRIGLHSDAVLVGNVGSDEKLSYTVMGDGVNIASRLEGVNKDYGTTICVSHSLFKEAGERLWVRPIDLIQVKGRKGEFLIYELMGIRDGTQETTLSEYGQALCKKTEKAFFFYSHANYVEAAKAYDSIALEYDDELSRVMRDKALSKLKMGE